MRLRPVILLLSLVLSVSAIAQQPAVPAPVTSIKDLRPGSVAVFKNGLAFVVRHGAAQIQNGNGQIDGIPAATLGSLWVATGSPGAVLEEVVAFRHNEPIPVNAANLRALLAANAGKTVTVTRDGKQFTGELIAAPRAHEDPRPGDPGDATSEDGAVLQKALANVDYILLRASGKIMALNASEITAVDFVDAPNLTTTSQDSRRSLRFRVRNAAGKVPLAVGYLERGLGWTPSYLIEIKEKNTAEMTMQAVVINDAEDLVNTDLFFVVGFPNFRYANIDSPMTLGQPLAEFLNRLNRDSGRRADSGVASQMLLNAMAADEIRAPEVELTPAVAELSGDSEQDLFLYSRPGATLKKGERGLYNVFTATVSYDEIYEWEVRDANRVDIYGAYQPSYAREREGIQNAAWHSLRLKNSSKFPWTTAPAIVIHGNRPIAQEMLSYTPQGAAGLLRLTLASDIHVQRDETEIERIKAAVRSGGSNFDAITVEGTLTIHNYKKTDAPMHIIRNIVGEVLSSTNNGKSKKTVASIQSVNPNSVIDWELVVRAGEEISIKYRYKILVRS